VIAEAHKLIELTSLPTFTTAMGKGGLNEKIPQYGGVHTGAGTHPGVKEAIEAADAVLWLGNYPVSTLLSGELLYFAEGL
jgi:pyruvate decarboxylase